MDADHFNENQEPQSWHICVFIKSLFESRQDASQFYRHQHAPTASRAAKESRHVIICPCVSTEMVEKHNLYISSGDMWGLTPLQGILESEYRETAETEMMSV